MMYVCYVHTRVYMYRLMYIHYVYFMRAQYLLGDWMMGVVDFLVPLVRVFAC